MKRWTIIGLAIFVVLVISYAGYGYFSHKPETARFGATKSEHLAKPININTASAAELQSIKGIGPVISERIIEGRPYNEISDILKVHGIGPKKFARMKDDITIN